MTTAMSYDGSVSGSISYVDTIATLAVVDSPTNTDYVAILPTMIVTAENRIYRDLDFLQMTTAVTATMAAGNRSITLAEGTLVVSDQINVITPSSTTNPEVGTRNPLTPATKEFLDAVFGVGTVAARGVPQYFCPFNDNLFLVGPFPDAAYTVEVIGTYRPDSLSSTNTTTFISLYLPDLMVAASMVFMGGWQKNYSLANSQPDDGAAPINWESQYRTLLKGATVEEARKKFEASGWSSQSPSPVATPTRG